MVARSVHSFSLLSSSPKSQSQIATMFWLMTAWVLLPPMPLMPTVAMLTVSLGAWNPLTSTCRGTIIAAAVAPATVVTNWRLDTGSSCGAGVSGSN